MVFFRIPFKAGSNSNLTSLSDIALEMKTLQYGSSTGHLLQVTCSTLTDGIHDIPVHKTGLFGAKLITQTWYQVSKFVYILSMPTATTRAPQLVTFWYKTISHDK